MTTGQNAVVLKKHEWLEKLVRLECRKPVGVLLAVSFGLAVWHIPPPEPLDENGVHFLATLTAAVTLWGFEVFDEYVVGLTLLLSWLLLDIAPTNVVLNGFSKSSWFFVLGVLGMAAAVTESGVLKRLTFFFINKVRPSYGIYTFTLAAVGFLITPLLPNTKGRMAITAPLTRAISDNIGLKPRSNGSAGLTLSAYVGLSQLNFLFLTGATTCLVGWSLLPDDAKAEFGWGTWLFTALPGGIVNFVLLLLAIQFLFRKEKGQQDAEAWRLSLDTSDQLGNFGPLTRTEWITLSVVCVALGGWISKSHHGVSEAWIALGALLFLLLTGVLDKKRLKNNIDWGFLLFFGIVYSLAGLSSHLKVDLWLKELMGPLFASLSFHPLPFLMAVVISVYCVRFFVFKTPSVILMSLMVTPWAQEIGIHPGVLLLTMLLGVDTWVFSYQQPSYQIAYYSTEERAFSHTQGRKLMAAKFAASFIVLAISVPYWSWLGYIKTRPAVAASVPSIQPERIFDREDPSYENAPVTNQNRRSRGEVTSIQKLLLELGFDPGPVDGIAGPRTREAIRQYQQNAGMKVDGQLSKTLVNYLRKSKSAVESAPVGASRQYVEKATGLRDIKR